MATLDELRAQTAAKQAAKKAHIDAVIEQEEIKLHEMIAQDDKLELGHNIAAVFARNTGKMVVVKKPARVAHKNFVNCVNRGTLNADVIETYLKGVLVYPTQSELQTILDETPGLLGIAVNKANELISQGEVEISGN